MTAETALARSVYGTVFHDVLWPAWEGMIRQRSTLRLLRFLKHTEWRSPSDLLALQGQALNRLITHVYANVPYYRRQMEERGLEPEDISSPEDLRKLPILSREQAQQSAEDRTAQAGARVDIRKSTGGSTGQPLVFGYNRESEQWRQATKFRAYEWTGYRLGEPTLHYWGPPMQAPAPKAQAKIALDRLLKRERFVDCTVRSEAALFEAAMLIARMQPRAILCFTQAAAHLARFIVEHGLRRWDDISVLCGAERLLPPDREVLEQAFGPRVFETYGAREVMLIASECEAHDGLHISAENLVVEVIVSEDGVERPARPGELGQIVVTDLHNDAMPFIRYAIGDLAIMGKDDRCSCGRSLPRLAAIEGRITETLRDASGAEVSGLLFSVIMVPMAEAVRQFQVVQHKDLSLTLKIVPGDSFDGSKSEAIKRYCADAIQGVPVSIETVADIPLTRAGKRKIVIVES